MMLLQVSEMSAKLEELEDELDELTSAMDEEHALSRLEVKGTCIEITTHTASPIAITKNTFRHAFIHTLDAYICIYML